MRRAVRADDGEAVARATVTSSPSAAPSTHAASTRRVALIAIDPQRHFPAMSRRLIEMLSSEVLVTFARRCVKIQEQQPPPPATGAKVSMLIHVTQFTLQRETCSCRRPVA